MGACLFNDTFDEVFAENVVAETDFEELLLDRLEVGRCENVETHSDFTNLLLELILLICLHLV